MRIPRLLSWPLGISGLGGWYRFLVTLSAASLGFAADQVSPAASPATVPAAIDADWADILTTANQRPARNRNEMTRQEFAEWSEQKARAMQAKLRGKVVLVDFWATWCGPCVAELPNVRKVYATYHDKGFEIVGISLENARLAVMLRRDSRRVRLEQGEAVFTVTHDPARPFFVETAAGTVRVTGTVFDVRAAPSGRLEVTVVEGHVAVRPIDADGHDFPAPRALAAGDRLVFDPATAALEVTRPASVEDALAWREGRVVFAGAPLREGLERFAAYHQKNISAAPEVAELPLGGRYTLDDLEQFLRSLEQALPVKVWRQGDGSVRIVAAPRAP